MQVEYRASAFADLDAIAFYTKKNWGAEQAQQYLIELRAVATGLSEFPNRFPLYQTSLGDFRKAPSGEHVIFYQIVHDRIEIVRVLHKSMEFEEKLG